MGGRLCDDAGGIPGLSHLALPVLRHQTGGGLQAQQETEGGGGEPQPEYHGQLAGPSQVPGLSGVRRPAHGCRASKQQRTQARDAVPGLLSSITSVI